ncbi:MAG TPA: hypothetical protein ENI34_09705 [candidate division WOR-3 bacterium]|uniref:Transposase DDE domain-containing protein n=1 Tax=candidate division WOR-3 bacterium TaxID=2052148 RepID=A0A9C9K0R9_UNCW3|nr:hypothetical protein [candidate division WOR-3 bacterium]
MTDNYTQISLSFQEGKIVTINFNGGNISSDAGLLLIREYDKKINFTPKVAQLLIDKRTSYLVDYKLIDLIRQRLYGIIAGYENANDARYLRLDHYTTRAKRHGRGGIDYLIGLPWNRCA